LRVKGLIPILIIKNWITHIARPILSDTTQFVSILAPCVLLNTRRFANTKAPAKRLTFTHVAQIDKRIYPRACSLTHNAKSYEEKYIAIDDSLVRIVFIRM